MPQQLLFLPAHLLTSFLCSHKKNLIKINLYLFIFIDEREVPGYHAKNTILIFDRIDLLGSKT